MKKYLLFIGEARNGEHEIYRDGSGAEYAIRCSTMAELKAEVDVLLARFDMREVGRTAYPMNGAKGDLRAKTIRTGYFNRYGYVRGGNHRSGVYVTREDA